MRSPTQSQEAVEDVQIPSLGWGSIMVGNRYWMPPPRQFQPMFQVSISNPTAMLHPVVMIQPVMYTRDLKWYT